MPDPRDVLPVLGWWCAVLVVAAFGVGALRAALDWRDERVARAEAREEAEAREQAHADALVCDAIHEAGRVAGHRAGYDVGHSRGYGEGYATGWQLGCSAGEARMRRANARAQLGLPARPAPRVQRDNWPPHPPGAFRGFGGRIGRQLRDTHHPPAPPPGFNDSEGDEG